MARSRSALPRKKGQALIWTANLLHGGDRQKDRNKTRWSQVTHYFFDNCAYYTPMFSDPFYGHIDFRDAYDIGTRSQMKQMYAGHEIDPKFVQSMREGGTAAEGGAMMATAATPAEQTEAAPARSKWRLFSRG